MSMNIGFKYRFKKTLIKEGQNRLFSVIIEETSTHELVELIIRNANDNLKIKER